MFCSVIETHLNTKQPNPFLPLLKSFVTHHANSIDSKAVTGAIDDVIVPFNCSILINGHLAAVFHPVAYLGIPGHTHRQGIILK